MCGRYVATASAAEIGAFFDVAETVVEAIDPNFNVAPTDPVPAVAVGRDGLRRLGAMRWGLVPSWSAPRIDRQGRPQPPTGAGMINARVETIATKPAFRSAFTRRRTLLPADGFYEWERRSDGTKQPWFVHHRAGDPLAFAAVWESWHPPPTLAHLPVLRTCAIVTTAADPAMRDIHERMPVILPPERWEEWLDPDMRDPEGLGQLLKPEDEGLLVRYRVTDAVNSTRNNGPGLVTPAPLAVPARTDPPVALDLS
ncbi:MAG: SOS response-associated peptidase [Acidimicrobiales bacterium]